MFIVIGILYYLVDFAGLKVLQLVDEDTGNVWYSLTDIWTRVTGWCIRSKGVKKMKTFTYSAPRRKEMTAVSYGDFIFYLVNNSAQITEKLSLPNFREELQKELSKSEPGKGSGTKINSPPVHPGENKRGRDNEPNDTGEEGNEVTNGARKKAKKGSPKQKGRRTINPQLTKEDEEKKRLGINYLTKAEQKEMIKWLSKNPIYCDLVRKKIANFKIVVTEYGFGASVHLDKLWQQLNFKEKQKIKQGGQAYLGFSGTKEDRKSAITNLTTTFQIPMELRFHFKSFLRQFGFSDGEKKYLELLHSMKTDQDGRKPITFTMVDAIEIVQGSTQQIPCSSAQKSKLWTDLINMPKYWEMENSRLVNIAIFVDEFGFRARDELDRTWKTMTPTEKTIEMNQSERDTLKSLLMTKYRISLGHDHEHLEKYIDKYGQEAEKKYYQLVKEMEEAVSRHKNPFTTDLPLYEVVLRERAPNNPPRIVLRRVDPNSLEQQERKRLDRDFLTRKEKESLYSWMMNQPVYFYIETIEKKNLMEVINKYGAGAVSEVNFLWHKYRESMKQTLDPQLQENFQAVIAKYKIKNSSDLYDFFEFMFQSFQQEAEGKICDLLKQMKLTAERGPFDWNLNLLIGVIEKSYQPKPVSTLQKVDYIQDLLKRTIFWEMNQTILPKCVEEMVAKHGYDAEVRLMELWEQNRPQVKFKFSLEENNKIADELLKAQPNDSFNRDHLQSFIDRYGEDALMHFGLLIQQIREYESKHPTTKEKADEMPPRGVEVDNPEFTSNSWNETEPQGNNIEDTRKNTNYQDFGDRDSLAKHIEEFIDDVDTGLFSPISLCKLPHNNRNPEFST